MTDQVTLYHNPVSRSRLVRWMLEEVGADYRMVVIDLDKGDQKSPDYLAVNPMGKVPAITHRGITLGETAAIVTYLADAFPDAGLAPPTSDPARGAYYYWILFGAGCFEPSMWEYTGMIEVAEPKAKMRADLGYGTLEDVIAVLKTALSANPYLVGKQFSAADISLGTQIVWAMMLGTPGLKDDPIFEAYKARIFERPKFSVVSDAGFKSYD